MNAIEVRVKPASSQGPKVETGADGELVVFVREKAINNQANKAAIKVLAEYLGVAKSRLKLLRGHKSRQKSFIIT